MGVDDNSATWDRSGARLQGPARAGASVHLVKPTTLTVLVQAPDGTAINDVEIEVWNLRKQQTRAGTNKCVITIQGSEYDQKVKPQSNQVNIKARKPHYGPPGQAAGEVSKTAALPKGSATTVVMVLQACANLTVTVRYVPVDAPVKKASVTVSGPVTQSLDADDTGVAKFVDIPIGHYTVTSTYKQTNALADFSRSKVGSADWAYDSPRTAPPLATYPAKTNKCNLYVFEMVTGAGFPLPPKVHQQIPWGTSLIAPNAGDWATPGTTVGNSTVVPTPEPGDVIAWKHNYSDATGHSGIVTYPKDATAAQKDLNPGDDATLTLQMRRQSIYAGHAVVEEDDHIFWHYYDENNTAETANIVFRRLSK